MRAGFLLFFFILTTSATAQSGSCSGHGEFIQTGQWLGGIAWSMNVDVGDVNGDGHPDLVFARDPALGNQVYLGDGSGLFTDTGQSLGANNSRDIALADLDMDGDLDMVVANTQVGGPGQPNRIYFNDGLNTGNFIDSGQSLGNEETFAIATGDVNGDTFIDVVFCNTNANSTVHLNDGSGFFSTPPQLLPVNMGVDGKLADLNGDGHLDLVISEFNSSQIVFINDGMGLFGLHATLPISSGAYQVAVADIDGDTHLDLVCGALGPNQIYINDGVANFTDSGQLMGTDITYGIIAGDIDGDCDVDLVSADIGFFRVYRNDGGIFSEIAANDDSGVAVQLADVNHDDTLDLIVASGIPDMVYLNLGPESDCNGNGIPDSVEIAGDPSIDCDGNGAIDLCEISSDPSLDCDGNGVLDSCATEILASDGAFADSFGSAVSVNGDKVIVGAFGDDTVGGTEDGSAYLFRYDTSTLDWIEEAHLFPSAGAPDDLFGLSVSLGKNVAIVGAPNDDTPAGGPLAGSVYIFRFDTATMSWFEEAHLFASDGAAGDGFGTSVSISGTGVDAVAIVGAPNANTSSGGTGAGATYVYRHDGSSWVEEAKLIASDGTNGDRFGNSVSISGNAVLVGAWFYDGSGISNAGSAYVYRYDGSNWIQESQLFHPTSSSDSFGTSVSLSGNVAIVGSKSNIGDATIFRWNGIDWILETHLPSPPPSSGYTSTNSFSVNVSGDVAVVGGWNQFQPTGGSAGVAYLYRRTGTTWIQERALLPQDQSLNDSHGASVGVSGGIAIVGASRHSHPSLPLFTGSAYLFNLGNDCDDNGLNDFCELISNPSLDCNGNGIIDPCDIASDPSLDCDGNGVLDSCESVFVDSGQILGSSISEDVALGDLDGDGHLDAWVPNFGQANRIWINDGLGNYTDSGQALGNSNSLGVALGDLDGDGHLDAWVANLGQANRIWINDGLGNYTDSGQALGNSSSAKVALGDLDGDGDLDAWVANFDQPNRVWINQGGDQGGTPGTFSDSGQALSNSKSMDVAFEDLDGDGDLDAWVTNYNQPNRVWINQGGDQGGFLGTFSDNGQALGNSNSNAVALGDLDSDGDLDAFVTNTFEPNRVWINQGGDQGGSLGTFADSGQALGNSSSDDVALGDLDGDGDLDAWVANNNNQQNLVWINDGLGNYTDSGQALGNSNSIGVALGDLDGDGDLDAWVANFDQPNRVWINSIQFCNDCDGNGIQDSVEIAADPSLDCNANGVLDSCDIDSGFSLDSDGSGVPDECEGMRYISGDSNGDGAVDVGDGIFVLDYLFAGGASTCLDASDANGDGAVDIGDAIFVLTYLFSGGVAPAPPFPDCGEDPTTDALECDSYNGCP